MPDILVRLVAVLVHALSLAARHVLMAVPVRVQNGVGTEQTANRAADGRCSEHIVQQRYTGQDVVSWVSRSRVQSFNLLMQLCVEGHRQTGIDAEIAITQECLRLDLGESFHDTMKAIQ